MVKESCGEAKDDGEKVEVKENIECKDYKIIKLYWCIDV